MAAHRQAVHRVGEDGTLPHHRPVQPAGPCARFVAEPRRVAHRAVGVSRGLLLLGGGPLPGCSPGVWRSTSTDFEGDDLGACGEALQPERRLPADVRRVRPRNRGRRYRRRRSSARAVERHQGLGDRWPLRVALGSLQLRDLRLLRLRQQAPTWRGSPRSNATSTRRPAGPGRSASGDRARRETRNSSRPVWPRVPATPPRRGGRRHSTTPSATTTRTSRSSR